MIETKDQIIHINNSVLQHGPWNDRIYIMRLDSEQTPEVLALCKNLTSQNNYGKIFAKIPASAIQLFIQEGFSHEASIPSASDQIENILIMSLFLKTEREQFNDRSSCDEILNTLLNKKVTSEIKPLPGSWNICACNETDVEEMADIYSTVFASYPFPIDDPQYLEKTMKEHIHYYGIRNALGKLIALSSAEIDPEHKAVEMSDFATLPEARGKHCARHLLALMEKDMKQKGMLTFFTIARAISASMNTVFSHAGYTYTGTLKKNTNIGGSFEDMNVWYRHS